MDTLSSSSSLGDDDDFLHGVFARMMALSNDGGVVEQGTTEVGGESGSGTGRPDMKRPRKFNEAGATPSE